MRDTFFGTDAEISLTSLMATFSLGPCLFFLDQSFSAFLNGARRCILIVHFPFEEWIDIDEKEIPQIEAPDKNQEDAENEEEVEVVKFAD